MNDTAMMNRAADNIRILSASMVEKAKSGHPGGAMLFKVLREEERDDLWFVRPVQAGEKVPEPGDGVDLERIDRLSIELPSRGGDDVTIWVDGLHFRKAR